MKNLSLVMLGAALGFGTMALTGGGASAAALQPYQPLAQSQQNADNGIIEVAQGDRDRRMRERWDWKRDGDRCSRRNDRCRHYHRGYYYETPWWTLPLIIGGYGSRHVEWCLDRYRSYDPRTNTWVSYSGNVNQCNSPYG